MNDEWINNIRLFYDKPRARVYKDSTTSISNATSTALTFNQERYDSQSLHSVASDTGRLTAPIGGHYIIGAHIDWAANTVGSRELSLIINGVALVAGSNVLANTEVGFGTMQSVCTSYFLAAGDFAEARVRQTSGGALNLRAGSGASFNAQDFWMYWISG